VSLWTKASKLSFAHGSGKKRLILGRSIIEEQRIKEFLSLYQTFFLSASEQLKANSVNRKAA